MQHSQAFDPALFRLSNEIAIISQLSERLFESVMPRGMTLAQFIILHHFERLGRERSLAELANIFQVTRAVMTSTLQKLAGKGLVDIKPNLTDRCPKLVTFSESGRVMRRACIAAVLPQIARIEALFAQTQINALWPGQVTCATCLIGIVSQNHNGLQHAPTHGIATS